MNANCYSQCQERRGEIGERESRKKDEEQREWEKSEHSLTLARYQEVDRKEERKATCRKREKEREKTFALT